MPESLRRKRGAPKYARSEPVLLVGYQHMYTTVYKCLTAHGTIVRVEQVSWDLHANLGVFPSLHGDREIAAPARPPLDTGVFGTRAPAAKPGAEPGAVPMGAAPSSGVIRMNVDRVLDSEGNPRPKPYIYERLRQVDGLSMEEARTRRFPDSKGRLKRYSGDLAYDVATGWIRIEPLPAHAEEAKQTVTKSAETASSPPATADILRQRQVLRQRLRLNLAYRRHPDAGDLSRAMRTDGLRRRRARRALKKLAQRLGSRTSRVLRKRASQLMHAYPGEEACDDAGISAGDLIAFQAMKDLPWGKFLHGEHHESVLKAYHSELDSLLSTVLRELKDGDPELAQAMKSATPCRLLLEFKRSGLWKARCVVQGFAEDKVKLDGADFDYSSDVVGLTAIRMLMLAPRSRDEAIALRDISTAFLQSDMFAPEDPPRYLRLKDPVTGAVRYFRQLGVVYGSASAPVRWMHTLHPWLVSIGFKQGKNEPCVFRHDELNITVASYVDDIACRGPRANVEKFMRMLGDRFQCKEVQWLGADAPLDHLGMVFFETEKGTYLSMQSYIEAMLVKLGMQHEHAHSVRQPISGPITDRTPLGKTEAQLFMSACGMIGWLAGTGRCDLKYAHSRISQHMAAPCKGALRAVMQAVRYASATRTLCIFQPRGAAHRWSHSSDSDHAGNIEPQNERRSQLGFLSKLGWAVVAWGSKASSVKFAHPSALAGDGSLPSTGKDGLPMPGGGHPVCHPEIDGLHSDVSSGAAEIYAASVALNEILHLSYIADEMGMPMDMPLQLDVDNSTAIAFSKGRVRRSKLKHIDVRQAWVDVLRDSSIVKLEYVNTKANLSDFFTKILDYETFERLRGEMLVACPIPPTGVGG